MNATFISRSYGEGSGRILEPISDGDLTRIAEDDLFGCLADAGFLILRGFQSDLESFTRLVKSVSISTTLDPAREFHSEVAQKVDAGFAEVGLHLENGNSPFQSHLAWFLCEKAASSGSQTTVCDGYRVWEVLSHSACQAFVEQDILYTRYVAEPQWRAMVTHLLGSPGAGDQIGISEVLALVDGIAGLEIDPQADGGIVYSYRTPAVHPTLFGTRLSFANSILGPSYNYEAPKITFADGRPIGEELLAEVRSVTEGVTEEIAWRDGDIAVIDNTRTMHGRRAITDPNRTIYNALSYVEVGKP